MIKYLFIYLIAINIIAIIITYADKQKAKKNKWRVPENTLIFISVLGGSVGMFCTMKLIHHKTRHKKFMIGIPLIFLIQISVAIYFIFFF